MLCVGRPCARIDIQASRLRTPFALHGVLGSASKCRLRTSGFSLLLHLFEDTRLKSHNHRLCTSQSANAAPNAIHRHRPKPKQLICAPSQSALHTFPFAPSRLKSLLPWPPPEPREQVISLRARWRMRNWYERTGCQVNTTKHSDTICVHACSTPKHGYKTRTHTLTGAQAHNMSRASR